MGLDQYAYHRRKGDLPDKKEEIAYWRKHNRLEGWMAQLYHDKTGDEDSFNCKELVLSRKDLEDLETVIENKEMPETGGFFFGGDSYGEYEGEDGYLEIDRQFIQDAKRSLESFGGSIIYTSWW
jgi:hypothetical protein